MKSALQYIAILIFASGVMASCENEIEFNGTETSVKMVLNSLLTPDSVVKVHVSRSAFFLDDDTSFKTINNATVKLFANDVFVENLVYTGDGIYQGTYKPKPGETIRLNAINSEFGEVSSTVEIPVKNPILSIDTTSIIVSETPALGYNYLENRADTVGTIVTRKLNVTINFQDNKDLQNFYRLKAKIKFLTNISLPMEYDGIFESNDMVFGSTNEGSIFGGGNDYSGYREFSDELFNGKKYGLTFWINISRIIYFPGMEPQGADIRESTQFVNIDLESISKSYYLYLKTRSANDSYIEYFSEPVQIYNNVENGIGFIGSYTPELYIFKLPTGYTLNWGATDDFNM